MIKLEVAVDVNKKSLIVGGEDFVLDSDFCQVVLSRIKGCLSTTLKIIYSGRSQNPALKDYGVVFSRLDNVGLYNNPNIGRLVMQVTSYQKGKNNTPSFDLSGDMEVRLF